MLVQITGRAVRAAPHLREKAGFLHAVTREHTTVPLAPVVEFAVKILAVQAVHQIVVLYTERIALFVV